MPGLAVSGSNRMPEPPTCYQKADAVRKAKISSVENAAERNLVLGSHDELRIDRRDLV